MNRSTLVTDPLDDVEGVGRKFELEAQEEDGYDIQAQVEGFRRCLIPNLGPYLACSSEDLLEASSSSSS